MGRFWIGWGDGKNTQSDSISIECDSLGIEYAWCAVYFIVISLNFNLCTDSQANTIITVSDEWDNWLKRLKLTPLIRVRVKTFLADWLYTTGFLHALAVPCGCDLWEGVTPPFSWIMAAGVSCYLLLVFENLSNPHLPVLTGLENSFAHFISEDWNLISK